MAEQWPGDSPAAWIDDIGHAIAERYRRIEDALRGTLERLTEQHLAAPDDVAARLRAIQNLREQAEQLAKTVDPDELAKWATEQAASGASAEISRVLLDFPAYAAQASQVSALTAGGAYAVAAVELDLSDSLRALNERILRAPVDAYQAMTSKHITSILTGITTQQALHRRILDEYLADGVTGFTDKGGRRWTIGAYSEMATRTAAARAWRDQSVASMTAAGITTFTPVIGSSACTKCGAWQGKIVTDGGQAGDIVVPHAITAEPTPLHVDGTLAEMRAAGWGHPNCRCVLVPGLPGGPDPTQFSTHDPQKQADREKLRELERDVRAAKRDGDPDEIGDAQAALRAHVDETGILRREYREQLPFAYGGDKNPSGKLKRPRRASRPAGNAADIDTALRDLIPGVNVSGLEHVTEERIPQVIGHLQPLEDLVRRFPALRAIPEIAFANDPRRSALAWVRSSRNRGQVEQLVFNLAHDLTAERVEKIREAGWFHLDKGTNGRTYVTVHEIGHAADFITGQAANREAMRLLRSIVDPQGKLKTTAGVLKRARARGLISEYATKSVYEMLAESFATVETSPKTANHFEKAVHAALVNALRGT